MKEENIKDYKIVPIENLNEIKNILYQFNSVFKPTLIQRVGDLEVYAKKLYNNAQMFAVIKGLQYIGFTAFYSNDIENNIAYLTQLAVKPEIQNKGIGKTLLSVSMEFSRRRGMKVIKLEVIKDNIKAISFYKKNGFKFCQQVSENSRYMIKDL